MMHRLNAFFLSPQSDLHHLGVQLVLVGVRVQLGFRRKAVVAAKSPTIQVFVHLTLFYMYSVSDMLLGGSADF